MSRISQGSSYEETGPEVEQIEQDTKKKRKIPTAAFVAMFVVLVAVGIIIAVSVSKKSSTPTEEAASPSPSSEGTTVGDDAYWDQYAIDGSYTEEEKKELRAWGYTGDEIEAHEAVGDSVDDLVAASKAEQEEARKKLSNPESPEYQALLNNTWVGQSEFVLPAYQEDATENQISYGQRTVNADYVKIAPHGHQLFLKVFLSPDSYVFMECPILRYMQLADTGNIVISYTEAEINGVTVVSDISEVSIDEEDGQ